MLPKSVDATRLMRSKGVHDPGRTIDWPTLIAFNAGFTDPVPAKREKAFAGGWHRRVQGQRAIRGRGHVAVGDDRLRARHVVIASGAKPVPLPMGPSTS